MLDQIIAICEKHLLEAGKAVFCEPHAPYIPEGWRGVLVVAEAQNLSKTNARYVSALHAGTPRDRVRRLVPDGDGRVGVAPWDDGNLRLAVMAALRVEPATVAVSNAVPWSLVTGAGANANPSDVLEQKAIGLWKELLPCLRPKHIVAAGLVAQRVLGAAVIGMDIKVSKWVLPSPRMLSPLSSMVSVDDLLVRFPEIRSAIQSHPNWVQGNRIRTNILYAALAVGHERGLENVQGFLGSP